MVLMTVLMTVLMMGVQMVNGLVMMVGVFLQVTTVMDHLNTEIVLGVLTVLMVQMKEQIVTTSVKIQKQIIIFK